MIGDKKKYFVTAVMIFIFVLTSGCDMNAGKRPYDYPPAKWVSEEPEIFFDGVYKRHGLDGYLILEGQSIEINVFFNRGKGVSISIDDSIKLIGLCVFHPNKFTISVKKEDDNIFNGQYKKITFIRVPKVSTN